MVDRFDFNRRRSAQWLYAARHPAKYFRPSGRPLGQTIQLSVDRRTDVRLWVSFDLPYSDWGKMPRSFPLSRQYQVLAQYDFCIN
jgi:hypothetical protein